MGGSIFNLFLFSVFNKFKIAANAVIRILLEIYGHWLMFCHQNKDWEFRERVGFPGHSLCRLILPLTKHIREVTNIDVLGRCVCVQSGFASCPLPLAAMRTLRFLTHCGSCWGSPRLSNQG